MQAARQEDAVPTVQGKQININTDSVTYAQGKSCAAYKKKVFKMLILH